MFHSHLRASALQTGIDFFFPVGESRSQRQQKWGGWVGGWEWARCDLKERVKQKIERRIGCDHQERVSRGSLKVSKRGGEVLKHRESLKFVRSDSNPKTHSLFPGQ